MASLEAGNRSVSDTPFAAEAKRFTKMLPILRQQYHGEFVALLDGAVIDHDPDDERLAERLYARLGEVPFYIGWTGESPSTYELPSPEAD